MSHLSFDPARLTLKDALDLAVLIEEEAEERYRDFAAQLAEHGTPGAAKLFADLAVEEGRHGAELAARRQARFPDALRTVNRGQIWDVEAPGFEQAQAFMDDRRALTVALACEGKARAFFAGLVEVATDAEARTLFAELEQEESEHIQRIKRALERLPAGGGGEPSLADGPVAG